MNCFSYLFAVEPNRDQKESVRHIVDVMMSTRLLKPRARATLIKVGPIDANGLVNEKMALPQILHLLDRENPWSLEGVRSIASAWWKKEAVYACSVFGLNDQQASKIRAAVSGQNSYLTAVPPSNNPIFEHLLDRSLIPVIAFHKFKCATSGALSVDDLENYGFGQPIYMDPELFMLRDSALRWLGEHIEGDTRPRLFP